MMQRIGLLTLLRNRNARGDDDFVVVEVADLADLRNHVRIRRSNWLRKK